MSEKVKAVFSDILKDSEKFSDSVDDAAITLERRLADAMEEFTDSVHDELRNEQNRIIAAFMCIRKVRETLFSSLSELGIVDAIYTASDNRVTFTWNGMYYSITLMEALAYVRDGEEGISLFNS